MKKVKIGVIGIGHLGNYHLQKYAKIPNCEIVAVSDIVEENATNATKKFNCLAFSDHRKLLGKVEAVSITAPTVHHYAIAKDFLSAGVHVLLEKPMTSNLSEADELLLIADKTDTLLQIGFVERFNPAIVALEKIIDTPRFIESHRLHPFFPRGTDVDVILDLMIHDLDIILHFVNSPLETVEAAGIPVLSDKIDIANARITFKNGCVANITASRITNKKMQKIRFFGFEGYHAVDYGTRELVSLSRKKDNAGKTIIVPNTINIHMHDPLEEEIKSFITSVVTRKNPIVSGQAGRDSLQLALQIAKKIDASRHIIS